MDTAIFISSTNFIMFTIVYNYYYFVNISKRYTAFQLFLSATLSVILSVIIICIKNSKFLKPLIFQGISPVQCSVFMYFPLFLPL